MDTYDALEDSQIILIQVPAESASAEIEALTRAGLTHRAKTFVLCETWSSTDILRSLARRGSSVFTTLSVATDTGHWLIVEGAAAAGRTLRALFESGPDRVLALPEGQKQFFFAAELLAGVLPLALMGRAEQALRGSSVGGRPLRLLLDGIAQRMLLDAAHTSHQAIRSPLRECPTEVARSHFQALDASRPELAAFLRHHIAAPGAAELFPQSAKLEDDEQAVPLEIKRA